MLFSSSGIGAVSSVLTMPNMSPFWCWFCEVRSFVARLCSDYVRQNWPATKVRISMEILKHKCLLHRFGPWRVWNDLACAVLAANGCIVKDFTANIAFHRVWRKLSCWVFRLKCSLCFCIKSTPNMFSLNSSMIITVRVHFLLLMNMSIFYLSLIFKVFPKAVSNELMFMQVTADPVSITQDTFLLSTLPEILGLDLSP
jgi:hypothetical protein